jgi:hypothetical protein
MRNSIQSLAAPGFVGVLLAVGIQGCCFGGSSTPPVITPPPIAPPGAPPGPGAVAVPSAAPQAITLGAGFTPDPTVVAVTAVCCWLAIKWAVSQFNQESVLFRDSERLDLAGHPHRFFGGDPEGVDQPGNFALAVLDRFARLDAQRKGQLVESLFEPVDAVLQHRLAFIARQPRHRFGCTNRPSNSFIDRRCIGLRHPERDFAGELVGHRQIGVRLDRLVVQIERVNRLELDHRVSLFLRLLPGGDDGIRRRR